VPTQNSSGGKDRLGNISKQGDRCLRSLFTAGALAVIRYAKIHGAGHRRGHYGQRPGVPRSKAEHMAAPTNAAGVKKTLANPEPSTHGPSRHIAAPSDLGR
jgi:hypothetical protein